MKTIPNRNIVRTIICDISDRYINKCEVDNKAIGSCGHRADYCMWARWEPFKNHLL